MVEQTEKYGASVKKNETAYNIAMDTDFPFFDHIGSSEALTKRFAGYMRNVTASEGVDIKHIVGGFDWAGLGKATVVDVRIFLSSSLILVSSLSQELCADWKDRSAAPAVTPASPSPPPSQTSPS